MAEQLGLQQIFGEGAAVDRHEGTGRALGVDVQRTRDQLFAGAALAADQDRGHGVGQRLDLRDHGLHGRGLRDDGGGGEFFAHGLRELVDLAPQAGGLIGAPQLGLDVVEFQRFGHVVVSALAHGAHARLDRAVGGHDDHRHGGVELAQAREHLQAVDIRQHKVAQHEIRHLLLKRLHAGQAGGGAARAEARVLRGLFNRAGVVGIVFDDQESGGSLHGS